ncbi:hypothetical protein HZH66_006073 [Vespula vulgaris]|uniref:Uncharacterized protein n=1 Tax=Vespula vulgaris TaxID=7454 RepID=A0A834K9N7_VESVU|nr:hypothetical protein HZH66_006073 [Vespula vulgaris]
MKWKKKRKTKKKLSKTKKHSVESIKIYAKRTNNNDDKQQQQQQQQFTFKSVMSVPVRTDDIPDRQAKDYRSLVSVRDGADFARGTVDETERDETGRFRAEERRKRPPRSESTRA